MSSVIVCIGGLILLNGFALLIDDIVDVLLGVAGRWLVANG